MARRSVLGEIQGIGKGDYGGHVIWDSGTDLPEFVGSVVLRVTPSDNDPGLSDSTVVFIDNVMPSIVVSTPSGEQTGDVSIAYTITNEGRDPVHLTCAYSEDGMEWRPATVEGAVTGIEPLDYEGGVIWDSGTDLPGRDLEGVRFRIIPGDIREGVSGDTEPFHVDNNVPPTVLVSMPSDPVAGVIPIEYALSDAEEDVLSIGCFYSKDGQAWHQATVSGDTVGIGSKGYKGLVQWDSIWDVGYGDTLRARFRIVPLDRDEGWSGTTAVFRIRNWLGDYNHDQVFDMDDLAVFREAWRNQDGTRNLGPVIGELPNWLPVEDGKIDFEDLRVFVVMWNWWYTQPGSLSKLVARLSKPVSDGSDAPVGVGCTYSKEGLRLSFDVRGVEDVVGAELLVQYDPRRLRVQQVERGALFPSEEASVVFLPHVDEEQGAVLVDAIRLDDPPETLEGRRSLIHLDLVRTRVASPGLEMDLVVFYDLRGSEARDIRRGTIRQRIALIPVPKTFALYPNWPNPFNGRTVIRYDLPEPSRVSVIVYDVSGRIVRRLVHGSQQAGSYGVVWNGRDEHGQWVASGVYVVRMRAGRFGMGRKVLMLK